MNGPRYSVRGDREQIRNFRLMGKADHVIRVGLAIGTYLSVRAKNAIVTDFGWPGDRSGAESAL